MRQNVTGVVLISRGGLQYARIVCVLRLVVLGVVDKAECLCSFVGVVVVTYRAGPCVVYLCLGEHDEPS